MKNHLISIILLISIALVPAVLWGMFLAKTLTVVACCYGVGIVCLLGLVLGLAYKRSY